MPHSQSPTGVRMHWPTMLVIFAYQTLAAAMAFLLFPEVFISQGRYVPLLSLFSPNAWGLFGLFTSLVALHSASGRMIGVMAFPCLILFWALLSTNYWLGGGFTPMGLVSISLVVMLFAAFYRAGGFSAHPPVSPP